MPITVTFNFYPDPNSEMIAGFSKNKLHWGSGGDALTIYSSSNRKDFTFRSNVFGGFPKVE